MKNFILVLLVAACIPRAWAQSTDTDPDQAQVCQKWKGQWFGVCPFVAGERILDIKKVDQNCVATVNWDKGRVNGRVQN